MIIFFVLCIKNIIIEEEMIKVIVERIEENK